MALKFKHKTKDEIPAEHQALYVEKNGEWVLDVEDAVDKSKLDEFRTTNVNLLKQKDELAAKFKDVDPDEYRTLKDLKEQLEAGKLTGTSAEKIMNQRLEALTKEHTAKLTAITTERDTLAANLARATINDAVVPIAMSKGLRDTAVVDLQSRVGAVFKLKEGKPTAYDASGNVIYSGTGEPMTLGEYVDGLVKTSPHLFKESDGTGSQQQQQSAVNGARNPWKKEHWNLTEQAAMVKKDPAMAKRLASAAGAKLPAGI